MNRELMVDTIEKLNQMKQTITRTRVKPLSPSMRQAYTSVGQDTCFSVITSLTETINRHRYEKGLARLQMYVPENFDVNSAAYGSRGPLAEEDSPLTEFF